MMVFHRLIQNKQIIVWFQDCAHTCADMHAHNYIYTRKKQNSGNKMLRQGAICKCAIRKSVQREQTPTITQLKGAGKRKLETASLCFFGLCFTGLIFPLCR